MTSTPPTDEELAVQARAGGQAALGELLSRYARRLHRHFALQFRESEIATDLVQEVFERVLRARDRMPDAGFRPWLWTIAMNLAHSERRRRFGGPSFFSLQSSEPEQAPAEETFPDEGPSPREMAMTAERTEALQRALEQLEEPMRQVILLKFFQDLPGREVAQILGVTEGTVWSRTHRALTRLRELLATGGDVR